MANVYGVNYTKKMAPTPANQIDSAQYGGRVRWTYDSYECSSTAKGTVIYLATIPEGAHVLPESKLYHDALGANTALAIGTTADTVKWSDSEATTAAGNIELDKIGVAGTAMTAATDLIVTVSGSGAATGTLELSLYVAYK